MQACFPSCYFLSIISVPRSIAVCLTGVVKVRRVDWHLRSAVCTHGKMWCLIAHHHCYQQHTRTEVQYKVHFFFSKHAEQRNSNFVAQTAFRLCWCWAAWSCSNSDPVCNTSVSQRPTVLIQIDYSNVSRASEAAYGTRLTSGPTRPWLEHRCCAWSIQTGTRAGRPVTGTLGCNTRLQWPNSMQLAGLYSR